jgi:dCTP deaminase
MSILVDKQIAQYCTNEGLDNNLKCFKITVTSVDNGHKSVTLVKSVLGVIQCLYNSIGPLASQEQINFYTFLFDKLTVNKPTYTDQNWNTNVSIVVELLSINKPMITPFIDSSVKTTDNGTRILSYGLSSAGYDVTLDDDFKIFTNINSRIIDPCNFDERCLVDGEVLTDDNGLRYVILPPNSYLLGLTKEYFCIPRDVMVVAVGKSTYARAGAIVNVTPIEPGFEGKVVIEISNATGLPMKIYANQGVSQFLFYRASQECDISYADRKGKYQSQSTLVLPKV